MVYGCYFRLYILFFVSKAVMDRSGGTTFAGEKFIVGKITAQETIM